MSISLSANASHILVSKSGKTFALVIIKFLVWIWLSHFRPRRPRSLSLPDFKFVGRCLIKPFERLRFVML